MNKHTPGPWKVNPSCGPSLTDIQIYRPHPATGLYVFIANAGPDVPATNPHERLANANLIAAAPEMLEILIEISHEVMDEDNDLARRLESVIKKARGES